MVDHNDDNEDEEVSQEITQGNNPVRPRRGRPRKPQTSTPNQLEADFQELMDAIEETPEPTTRSIEEIVEYNKKIITMIQNLLMLDLKTISPKNTARISTPNGIQKFEIGGLPPSTRQHLIDTMEIMLKAVAVSDKQNNAPVDEKAELSQLAQLAEEIYGKVPGLDTPFANEIEQKEIEEVIELKNETKTE